MKFDSSCPPTSVTFFAGEELETPIEEEDGGTSDSSDDGC